jgi:uncharacterized Zn finger protein
MQNQPQQINIPLDKTIGVYCEECESQVFSEGLILRKASKFLTGTAQDSLMPMATFYCVKCGHVNEDFLPQGLKKVTND